MPLAEACSWKDTLLARSLVSCNSQLGLPESEVEEDGQDSGFEDLKFCPPDCIVYLIQMTIYGQAANYKNDIPYHSFRTNSSAFWPLQECAPPEICSSYVPDGLLIAPGIAFDMGSCYRPVSHIIVHLHQILTESSTVAIRFHNGNTINIAKIPGDDEYTTLV
ncbi:hypothetical protein BDD12DRAFT_808798 [Trichophaea hybrida]|nr:hypothetical protein BDD12DRAFT_808798 [Trichophaea hybrida]